MQRSLRRPPAPALVPAEQDLIAEARRQWRAHWGEEPLPSMAAVTSIMRAHQILLARLNRLLAPWSLTFARYEALLLLFYSRSGALPLGKIGSRLQVHPTSVTNTIDGLERLGLVSRAAHDRDRRMTLATITEHGRAVAREATAALNEARFGMAPLSDGACDELFEILRAVRIDAGDFAPP